MTEPLVVIADRQTMGEIRRDRRGRLTFVYEDRWRSRNAAFPLSLSMPLVVAEHDHARIEPWAWGLLPDNEAILARWGRGFHVSPRNVFALLGAVGEDCPGAVQLVRPNRVDDMADKACDLTLVDPAGYEDQIVVRVDPDDAGAGTDGGIAGFGCRGSLALSGIEPPEIPVSGIDGTERFVPWRLLELAQSGDVSGPFEIAGPG